MTNPAGLIDAVLDDGDDELAGHSVTESPEAVLGEHTWLRLAEARQKTHPADAPAVHWRLIDSTLQTANRRAYASALRLLNAPVMQLPPAARQPSSKRASSRSANSTGVAPP